MSVLIVGANGSMGRRYQAILRHLEQEYVCADFDTSLPYIDSMAKESDGVIIASPTKTHIEFIKRFIGYKKPILCVKPISTSIEALRDILMDVRDSGTNLTMTMQYKMLCNPVASGWSYYNYYNTGKDGLIWDCTQIIGLSKGLVRLDNDSPVWKCCINGQTLSIADMDGAYVEYVKKWLRNPGQDLYELKEVHEKTHEVAKSCQKS